MTPKTEDGGAAVKCTVRQIVKRDLETEVCPLCNGQIYVHGTTFDRSVLERKACAGLTVKQLRAMAAARNCAANIAKRVGNSNRR